jgi:Phage integrase family
MTAARHRAPADGVTLDRARDEIMTYFAAQTDSPSTLSRLRRVFRKLSELDVRTLHQVDDDVSRRYERSISEAVVGAARLNLMRDFRTVCHTAVELGLLLQEPVYPLLRGKPGAIGKPALVSRGDVIRIFATHRPGAHDPWEKWRRYAVFAVAVYTGLLRDDILDMPVTDIDLDRGEILVRRRKGNKRSTTPLPLAIHPDLKGILSHWLPQTGGVWVFPGKRKIGRWFGSGCKKLRAGEELVAMGRTSGVEAVVNFNSVRRFHFRALESIEGLGALLKGAVSKKRKDRPSVVLTGESEAVFIRDKSKGVVRGSEYELLSVLREQFPKALSKDQLTRLTGGTETWRKAWRELRKDPEWKAELIARGEPYEDAPSLGYRMNKY